MSQVLIAASGNRKPASLLVAGYFEKEGLPKDLIAREPEFAKALKAAVEQGRFSGKTGESFSSYDTGFKEAPEILLVGLGLKKNHRLICCRKAAGRVFQGARALKARTVRVLLESFTAGEVGIADAAGYFQEIAVLAAYQFNTYKQNPGSSKPPLMELVLPKKSNLAAIQKKMGFNRIVAEGALIARNLINEPGNVMNATRLAADARKLALKKKFSCRVLGESEMKRLKMGGILAVNQGSLTPPAMIVMEYGSRYKSKGTICLVGKGVTFDTGGISIKPAKDMEKMKYDMSGAAAVIGTMAAVADLKLHRHVVGITPAVENNVSADPQRPGDIIRISNGKTVEVINTDAEGRLILADALVYAGRYKPKAVIDLATLTGMCAYTFGDKCCAVLGTDSKLIQKLRDAGNDCGERCWELPLYDEYADSIKGHHSDLLNVGGAYGGTITAAMFLKEFVPEKTAWAHLDIAGMAWAESSRYDCPKGGTGFGVKLLTTLLSAL